jgi:hypothetical protein
MLVMRGLDPRIHRLNQTFSKKNGLPAYASKATPSMPGNDDVED